MLNPNLIQITRIDFSVELDIRYASENNFTGKVIYKNDICYLYKEAAEKLSKAIYLASNIGYGIKIFDGYRPTEAQYILWNHTPDPDFLAPPDKGSPHSRGVAVDLTLTKSGVELDMGTEFDEFTPLSHHANIDISKEAQINRTILLGIMTAAGWDNYMKEWWHYQLFNSKTYRLFSDVDAGTGIMT